LKYKVFPGIWKKIQVLGFSAFWEKFGEEEREIDGEEELAATMEFLLCCGDTRKEERYMAVLKIDSSQAIFFYHNSRYRYAFYLL